MGNCQAAEAATVVIEHPGGKVERMYWSVSASEVMGSNPGHYIAVVVAAPPHAAAVAGKVAGRADGSSSAPVRHLKLLRPDDTLHIGHVYRLISFEEVLKEFAAKKHVKLSRLLLAQKQHDEKKKRETSGSARRSHDGSSAHCESSSSMVEHPQQQQPRQASRPMEEEDAHATTMGGSGIISGGRLAGTATRHGQWRPSLQSIAEAGN
ncbi:hypothetical protein Taro_023765 [Colocasia esculenta]|uniref:Uncharacterized protein n=1 Tax=Colocasia esculenta TaxID=4460 RepID=A0A843V4M1_COLES|nr:hypothetical protein [Colocasia esculenta]